MNEHEPNGKVGREDNPADVAELLRRLLAAEEELSPFFLDMLLARQEGDAPTGRQQRALNERVLRRLFPRLGLDYDEWQARRRRQRTRTLAAAVTMLVLVVIVLAAPLGVLEAVRRPLVQWLTVRPPRGTTPEVVECQSPAQMQGYFSVTLPLRPPAGYRIVGLRVVSNGLVTQGYAYYQRGDPSDPDDTGAGDLTLEVRTLQDEAFELPAGGTLEPVSVVGRAAFWVRGTAEGPNGTRLGTQGGWVIWEEENWKFGLTSRDLTRAELLRLAEELLSR